MIIFIMGLETAPKRAFCFCTEGDRLLEVLHRSVEIALQSHSIYEHDRFTNTGSGQTREKADTKGGFASV